MKALCWLQLSPDSNEAMYMSWYHVLVYVYETHPCNCKHRAYVAGDVYVCLHILCQCQVIRRPHILSFTLIINHTNNYN